MSTTSIETTWKRTHQERYYKKNMEKINKQRAKTRQEKIERFKFLERFYESYKNEHRDFE